MTFRPELSISTLQEHWAHLHQSYKLVGRIEDHPLQHCAPSLGFRIQRTASIVKLLILHPVSSNTRLVWAALDRHLVACIVKYSEL